jgi:16S rRNA processing protein RimM
LKVVVGRLTGAFGVRGEMKCRPGPAGAAAFAAGRSYALGAAPGAREVRCRSVRRHHEKLLLAFEGIDSPEAARALAGSELYGEQVEAELGPDEYLDADLVGLRLLDEAGRELGKVTGVRHFPAQDCLVVGTAGSLVPLVKAFVRRIDLAAGTIVTSLPEGLLEPGSGGVAEPSSG